MNPFLTVSQINNYISYKFKSDAKLKGIAIRGELTGYVRNSKSGHAYFSLKDENSLIKCVMFSNSADKLRFKPENGMSVIAFGNVDVYERDGVYQLMTFELIPDGIGVEAMRLERLKEELSELGVFSKEKKLIFKYPKELAVVTSADGAALGDIITTVKRRYPLVKLSVYPTSVQGINAPDEIAKAISCADKSSADTIIVARGGGSKEDLAAYNTKQVALAIYSCKTPVISAVGHEIDVSFADAIADLRAPTPTGAAELATPDITAVITEISALNNQMYSHISGRLNFNKLVLDNIDSQLTSNSPVSKIAKLIECVDSINTELTQAYISKITMTEYILSNYEVILNSLNPDNLMKKGYAIVSMDDKIISSAKMLSSGDSLIVKMYDGSINVNVSDVERNS